VRCLVDVPGPKLPADLPGYLRSTVAPQVPPELQQAFLTAIDNEAIRSMQNKQVSCQPMHQPGEQEDGSFSAAFSHRFCRSSAAMETQCGSAIGGVVVCSLWCVDWHNTV
jgi:hypothetical protein